jgi:hypothetical protein
MKKHKPFLNPRPYSRTQLMWTVKTVEIGANSTV